MKQGRKGDAGQGLRIRVATPKDEEALCRLARRLTSFQLPSWRTAAEIADADARAMLEAVSTGSAENEVFIAERERAPIGCLYMQAATDFFGRRHAHVSVIAVAESAEGSGVGRALMHHAERWASERGLSLLTLNVFSANARARRFYERAGFTPELIKYARQL